MLLSLTTQTNFHTSIFETSLFSCNISPKKTQRSAFATQFYFCSQSWQVKLADQTKLKDTKQRRVWILLGLCKGENENSLIFIEVFGGVCFHRWSTVPLCLWKQATCSKLHKDSWPGEGWGVQAEMGTTKLGGESGNPSIHGAGDMHMEGDSMVYIPLYPVQRFPANKQVMKNSESYVRFSSLCVLVWVLDYHKCFSIKGL